MPGPDMSPSADERSNNELLHNVLSEGLLELSVRYSDAHYLDATLAPTETYPGGQALVSDYPAYMLKAADKINFAQRLGLVRALEAGEPFSLEGLTRDHHQAFLAAGVACLDVQITPPNEEPQSWALFHLKDMNEREPVAGLAITSAAEAGITLSPDEAVVYHLDSGLCVADAFTEPHLHALISHLASERAAEE